MVNKVSVCLHRVSPRQSDSMPVLEAPRAEVRARVGQARAESVGEVEDRRPGRGPAGRCRWAPNGGWAAAAGRPRYGLTRTASASFVRKVTPSWAATRFDSLRSRL